MPNRNVVFVVDDDPGMLRSVARMLRQFGYASSLFQSAEAFAEQTDFDEAVCVLLDINLGDGSGIELRHRLKEAGNTVPVIYMTGNDSSAVRSVWVPRLSHQAVLGHVANRAAQASLGFMTHVPARAGCPLSRGDRKTSTSGEHFRVWHKTDMSLQSPHVGCWGMNGRRSDFA